jgi:hypothetical protein
MEHLEQDKIAQVLESSSLALRKLAAERDYLMNKVAEQNEVLGRLEKRAHAEKVASMMWGKGLNTELDFGLLVADLEKAASEGKLATIEEAVSMVGPNMSLKTAALRNDDNVTGTGVSDFERFLTGQSS